MENEQLIIGITCGDLNGIGLEVIMKTLAAPEISEMCTPVVFASSKVVSYHRKALNMLDFNFHICDDWDKIHHKKPNLYNVWAEPVNLEFGKEDDEVGAYSLKSIDFAIQAALDGKVDAVVTAPICKSNIKLEGGAFTGHTGYLGEKSNGNPLMILASDQMRVALVTGHLPIKGVPSQITQERVFEKIKQLNEALKLDFNVRKPRIAVLGLNPHAGDNGLLGDEEKTVIIPALEQASKKELLTFGPFPADSFFGTGEYKKYDGILAMYHDQGLAPFKALSFGSGVNFTAGLPFVRTSPDHGTAFSIAGKGEANEQSFRQSLYAAIDIARTRKENLGLLKNALKSQKLPNTKGDRERE